MENKAALLSAFEATRMLAGEWKVFVDDEQPQWTFTDCVNYAVIQYLGVTEVITFDPNFSAPGMTVLPGVTRET